MSDSLGPHEPQHARPPCPSPTPKPMSIVLVMPSNHLILCCPLLLLPSIFPASGSFQMSQLSATGGQSIGVSASTSVPPMNTQDLVLNLYCFYTDIWINFYHLILHFLFSLFFSMPLVSSPFPLYWITSSFILR